VSELVVVATERQAEIASREGARAETRRRLEERLCAAFVGDVRFASAPTARAALASVLAQALEEDDAPLSRSASQLSRSAAAWEQLIDSVDDAIEVARARGVDASTLGAIEDREPTARLVRRAMNALDARLARDGLVDARLRPFKLGEAIARARDVDVARVVGASRVRARFVTRWNAADAAWWRAMSAAFTRVAGGASVEMPSISKPIDATRASDAFELVVSEVAQLLDEAPVEFDCATPFADLALVSRVPSDAHERIALRRALDADAQARAVAKVVSDAIDEGTTTDRIVVAIPRGASERTRRALATQFEEMDVALHVRDLEEPSALVDVAFALLAVGSAGLPRADVAAILRSRALSAEAIAGVADARVARRALHDLARVLEATPTADGEEPLARLVATASASKSDPTSAQRAALAERVGRVLLAPVERATRAAHAKRARAFFAQVGLAARAGGAVRAASARDAEPSGLVAAERAAYARDARALEALTAALAEVERAGVALGDQETCTVDTFAHELARALRARGAGGAARAGAVRAVALDQIASEPLDVLVVVDANDRVLPARAPRGTLVPPSLDDALAGPRSLVDLALAACTARRVVLCHRVADDDGAALAPSPIVSWLERGGVPSELVHSTPLASDPTTAHERELTLVALAPGRAIDLAPHAAHVAAREMERESIHATGDAALGRLTIDDALRALLESETGGGARPLSVTAVERVARCAFQGFAAHVLGAIDDDARTDDTPDRREEGILAHEALGAAFTATRAMWPARPRDPSVIEREAMRAADEVLARDGGALARAALARIRAEVARIVALAIEDDAWDFVFAERGFGGAGDEWPAFVIERDGARVALRGRVDRIDVAHDGNAARAIDYKRRVTLPAIVELGVTSIQVPLYALVAKRSLGLREARGRYVSTISPARASSATFDARFAALVREEADGSTEATRFAIDRVRALRDGEIAPKPIAPKWCAQCGLDGACRRPRFAVTMIGREESD